MTAIAAMTSTGQARRASFVGASLTVADRTIRKFIRTPQLVVLGTVQGALFLFIFRYVFGGAIRTGGVPYVDFLVPGFVATTVLFAGMTTATGMAEDLEQGFIDRLRSLPIPRAAVLTGRAIADTGTLTWNLAVTVAIGFAVGFHTHGSVLQALAAFGLCIVFGFAFVWLFVAMGLVAGNAQAAQGASFLVFPLTFISSAYVPVSSMPGWLQAFARHQPITPMVDAVRALSLGDQSMAVLGHGPTYHVGLALAWAVGLIAVLVPLSAYKFRRS